MRGILAEGRGYCGIPVGVHPFHGDHPGVPLEVAGCGEVGEVPLEIILMPAGLALDAINKKSINIHGSFVSLLKMASDIFKGM
jgi:hypothetical protein